MTLLYNVLLQLSILNSLISFPLQSTNNITTGKVESNDIGISQLENNKAKLMDTNEGEETLDEWMPDKNLQTAIAKQLKITTDQLTKDAMLKLTAFDGASCGITSLKGMEYATNLKADVNLNNNNISDITPLYNTPIYYLRLSGNNISDVSQFLGLTGVKTLVVPMNQIYDLSPLKDSHITTVIATDQRITLPSITVYEREHLTTDLSAYLPNGEKVERYSTSTSMSVPYYTTIEDSYNTLIKSKTPKLTATWNEIAFIKENYNAIGSSSCGFSGSIYQPVTYLPNLTSLNGESFTMRVGDAPPTASDFKATATDRDGKSIDVSADLSKVDLNVPGSYDVTLSSDNGLTKVVQLIILPKLVKLNVEFVTLSNVSYQSLKLSLLKTK